MKLKNPNKTARKTPMIATVNAFLSEGVEVVRNRYKDIISAFVESK